MNGGVKDGRFRIERRGTEHGKEPQLLAVAVVATSVLLAVGALLHLRMHRGHGIQSVDRDVLQDPKEPVRLLGLVDHAT